MPNRIVIADKIIEENGPPFIIAEAGVNHEGDLGNALKMIELAAAAGADAIKFQTYKAEKLAVKESPAYWNTRSTQREFFSKYDAFGPEEYYRLAEHCKEQGIIFISTPFDLESVDFLDPILPCYKVASADLTCYPLLEAIARKNKPILLSTGAATLQEIKEAVHLIEAAGNRQLVILHCVLNYPNRYETANLNTIKYLKKIFPDKLIGYSDHTVPDEAMLVLTAAYLLGATVIEKHFTLDKTLPGNDHYHAMDAEDLAKFVAQVRFIRQILGETEKMIVPGEEEARKFARRSLVAKTDIAKGQVIDESMLTWKRPGTGIPPSLIKQVLGRKANVAIAEDQIIQWEMLD